MSCYAEDAILLRQATRTAAGHRRDPAALRDELFEPVPARDHVL
jgi:hypothetical protein